MIFQISVNRPGEIPISGHPAIPLLRKKGEHSKTQSSLSLAFQTKSVPFETWHWIFPATVTAPLPVRIIAFD